MPILLVGVASAAFIFFMYRDIDKNDRKVVEVTEVK